MLFAPSPVRSPSFRGPLPDALRHAGRGRTSVRGRRGAKSLGLRRIHRFLELAGACILMASFLVLALFA